ncbi:MAG: PAS domain S-box protein [Vulcanimicrobiota bacterium]
MKNIFPVVKESMMEEKSLSEYADFQVDEELYRQITAGDTAVMLLVDPETGKIINANPAACKFYGYPAEDLKGMDISRIDISPSGMIASAIDAIMMGRQRAFLVAHRLASGEIRNVEVHSVPINMRNRTVLFCIIEETVERMQREEEIQKYHNKLEELVKERTALLEEANMMLKTEIEERKMAEHALQESEDFLKSIVENIPDMIFVKEPEELRFVRFNRAGEELLGFDRTEMYGKNDFDFFPEDEADFFTKKDREVLSGGRLIDISEEPINTRYKGERLLHTKKIPILDEQGNPKYLLGISEDVTEYKKAEEQLKASLKEKETLLKEMYHRVKNNMQLISSLLHLQARASTEPNVKEALAVAQSRIKSMALVHEKLYHSHSLTQIDFGEYLKDIISLLSRSYGKRNIHCRVEAENISLSIETAIPLGIIVNELISNAMKYAFPDDREGELLFCLSQTEDGRVTMTARDDGAGIPDTIDCLNPPSLGLQLVNDLVRQINGVIELDRSRGTKFVISFTPPVE